MQLENNIQELLQASFGVDDTNRPVCSVIFMLKTLDMTQCEETILSDFASDNIVVSGESYDKETRLILDFPSPADMTLRKLGMVLEQYEELIQSHNIEETMPQLAIYLYPNNYHGKRLIEAAFPVAYSVISNKIGALPTKIVFDFDSSFVSELSIPDFDEEEMYNEIRGELEEEKRAEEIASAKEREREQIAEKRAEALKKFRDS